jgi:glycosyltransferase involved in cell wall biosynthesis
VFERKGVIERLHHAGILQPPELMDAYHAMDVFAFASRSETQGMVLTEAMAAGVPVVGLDAPGVREVVRDQLNGRLLREQTVEAFAAALQWVVKLSPEKMQRLRRGALQTAEDFSLPRSANKALGCYEALREKDFATRSDEYEQWERVVDLVKAEWDILMGMAGAAGAAFSETVPIDRTPP